MRSSVSENWLEVLLEEAHLFLTLFLVMTATLQKVSVLQLSLAKYASIAISATVLGPSLLSFQSGVFITWPRLSRIKFLELKNILRIFYFFHKTS